MTSFMAIFFNLQNPQTSTSMKNKQQEENSGFLA